jgi:HSP20 family protein
MFWSDPFVPLVAQFTGTTAFVPPADVTVSDGDMDITMDLPGLKAEDLSIELLDGTLIVRGERKGPEVGDDARLAHTERAFGRFERRIRVPDGLDPDRITASVDDGVLSLIVPKPERLKPKNIAIDSGTEQRQLETAAG